MKARPDATGQVSAWKKFTYKSNLEGELDACFSWFLLPNLLEM